MWPAIALLGAFAGACGGTPDSGQPPASYLVRGIVRQLPAPEGAARELLVHHEAIPEFEDADGEVVGMNSMTMSFPMVDQGLAAELEVGDRIEMKFEVRWNGGNPLAVTAIERLPAETRLNFEAEP